VIVAGGIRKLREEKEGRRGVKKLGPAYRWYNWHRLSTVHSTSKLDSISSVHSDVKYSWSSPTYLTHKEFTNRLAIIFISAGAFGIGIGQLVATILRG
jgi:hypothetical protein